MAQEAPDVVRTHQLSTDEFDIRVESDGITHVRAKGFWTAEAVDRYFAALMPVMDRMRRRHGRALVLVDKRTAGVQSTEVATGLMEGCRVHYAANDRLAVVTPSSLQTLQTRRVVPTGTSATFTSMADAQRFLREGATD